jgi:hypothetical protein
VAPRSRTRSRVDRSSYAMVTIMVALSRYLQVVAWHGAPAGSNLTPRVYRKPHLNVSGDDRAALPFPDPVCLAVQVEEPT